MKKKLFVLSLMAMLVAICSFGTAAYYSAQDTAHNVITMGNVNIAIYEWADEEKTIEFSDVGGVLPSQSVTKVVEIKNTGSNDAWIRVRIEKNITLKTGEEGDADYLLVNINSPIWIDGGDGYYYYSKKLSEEENTEPIFTKVDFSKDMDNEYVDAVCSVDVYAEAVQSANNGDDALSAVDWPDGYSEEDEDYD